MSILIKWLKTGPKYAKVSTIEVSSIEAPDLPIASLQNQQSNYFKVWQTK